MKHRATYIVRRAARNLHDRRVALGLRQEDVAARMRVRPSQYARLERGELNSGLVLWLDAMWALEMSPDDLLDRLVDRVP